MSSQGANSDRGTHFSKAEVLLRTSLHVLFSKALTWSPWWTHTCRARSSVCRSSWSTAAGMPGARSGGSLCSGKGWSEGSHHPLHSDRSYGRRKAGHYEEDYMTEKMTLQWMVNPSKKTFRKKTSRNWLEAWKHTNTNENNYYKLKISSLPH